ncbi:Choline/ethanolaminephosphotransferase 2 [Capsicum baccatum]|uniref:Choline/ethanolaminephosphotransferase 2 n=1 Tax=Capsicum baccatum TaxID=33114 RepID=A0A2G2UYZ5_CAPBA|nr:Choline/ethanolaminephosphotransferase 2 [Capsicum baccatum]
MELREEVEYDIWWQLKNGNSNFWFGNWIKLGALYYVVEQNKGEEEIEVKEFIQNGKWNEEKLRKYHSDEITLTGFLFLVTSALLGYIYSPQLDSPPPRWVNFAHGLLLFLYQTFDAVDGKQARRTNSSSPLGELFDHGCDALACAFEALAFGSTAMCGRNVFWFWVISAVPFYFATWESYFTNTLVLPVVNGPTEGLMLIYFSHFFTALVGSEWWAQPFGKSMPLVSWVPFLNVGLLDLQFFTLFFRRAPGFAFSSPYSLGGLLDSKQIVQQKNNIPFFRRALSIKINFHSSGGSCGGSCPILQEDPRKE